jgi:hypothetical protein
MGISTFPQATAGGTTTLPAVGGSIFFAPTTGTRDFSYIEFDFGTPLAAGGYEFTLSGMTYNSASTNKFVALDSSNNVLATQTGTSIIGKLTTTSPIQKVAFKNDGNLFGFSANGGMTITPGIKTITKGVAYAANSTQITMTNYPSSDAWFYYKSGYYDRTTNIAYHMYGTSYNSAQMYTGVPNLTTGDIVWTARASRTSLSGSQGNVHYGSNMGSVQGFGGVFWNQGQYYSGSWSSTSDWWFFNEVNNTWGQRAGASMRGQVTMVQIASDKIMAIGGYRFDGTYDTQSRIYNTTTDAWQNFSNMPTGTYGGMAIANSLTNAGQVALYAVGYQNESNAGVANGPMYYTVSNATWNAGNSGGFPWPGGVRFSVGSQPNMQAANDGTNYYFWTSDGILWKVPIAQAWVQGSAAGYTPIAKDANNSLYDATALILGTNMIIGFNDAYGFKYNTTQTFPAYLQ